MKGRRRKKPKPQPFQFEFDVSFHGEAEVIVEALDQKEAERKVREVIYNAMGAANISGTADEITMEDPRVYEEEICAICGCDRREAENEGQLKNVDYFLDYDRFKDTSFPFKNASFVCPKHLMRPGKHLKDLRKIWREGHWLDNTPNRIWPRRTRRASA